MNITFPVSVTAIDPGLSGAVANLEAGVLKIERDFKTGREIAYAVRKLASRAGLVLIEKVHAMPGEGVCSVFAFGKSTGTALGAIACSTERSPVEVAPQAWQNFYKTIFWGGSRHAPRFKTVTRDLAIKIFPAQAELFKRKKDHNSADAALLALYGAFHFELLCAQRGSPGESGVDRDKLELL